jgi:hypothetical protein
VLEGEGAEIDRLRERIFADKRHHTKVVLERGTKPDRAFPDWSMAFRAATPEALAAWPALSDLGEEFFHAKLAAGGGDGAMQFLTAFRDDQD